MARQIYFACASIGMDNELLTKIVAADTPGDASQIYHQSYSHYPAQIMGPFYKKRTQVLETTRVLKFSNQIKKAEYQDWLVNAFLLKEPANQAYLVFIKRLDDKKIPPPQGTITVPLSELRII